jgi:hypothetical protein
MKQFQFARKCLTKTFEFHPLFCLNDIMNIVHSFLDFPIEI